MSKKHKRVEPAKPLAIMFDMMRGRADEIKKDEQWHNAPGYVGPLMEMLEKALGLLEPFVYPRADHVVMEKAALKCLRCGTAWTVEDMLIGEDGEIKTAQSVIGDVRKFDAEHAACLPWIAIEQSLYAYLRELMAINGICSLTSKRMVNTIKSIVNDAKEGRL